MSSLKQRFDTVKKQLRITYKEAGEAIQMSEAAFGMALKRESLNELQLAEIENKLGISKTWLQAGEGEMLSKPSEPYQRFYSEDGIRLLNIIEQHLPDEEASMEVRQLRETILSLYEYKEAYLKAKEAYMGDFKKKRRFF